MQINDDATQENDNVKKLYYNLTELADLLSVTPIKLKQLCTEFDVTPMRRGTRGFGKAGIQWFTHSQVDELKLIVDRDRLSRVTLIKSILSYKYPVTFRRYLNAI